MTKKRRDYSKNSTIKKVDRVPIYDLLCNDDVFEYFSKEKISPLDESKETEEKLLRIVGKAVNKFLDNHSAHISKETQQYLRDKPGRFEFVFTPKHGSWLNLIESFISKISRSLLRHIRVQSKEELVERIYRGIEEINQEPVIFRWRHKMDEIVPA